MSSGEFTDAESWDGRVVARKVSDAAPRCRVVTTGVIRAAGVDTAHGVTSYECALDDGTGEIGLLFLGRRNVAGLVTGTRCTVEGTARMEDGRLVIWNPLYRIEPTDG